MDIDHGVEEFGGGGGIGDEVYYEVVEESEASCDVNRVQVDRVDQPFSLIEQIILIDALRQSFIRAFSRIRMTQFLEKLFHFFHMASPRHFHQFICHLEIRRPKTCHNRMGKLRIMLISEKNPQTIR